MKKYNSCELCFTNNKLIPEATYLPSVILSDENVNHSIYMIIEQMKNITEDATQVWNNSFFECVQSGRFSLVITDDDIQNMFSTGIRKLVNNGVLELHDNEEWNEIEINLSSIHENGDLLELMKEKMETLLIDEEFKVRLNINTSTTSTYNLKNDLHTGNYDLLLYRNYDDVYGVQKLTLHQSIVGYSRLILLDEYEIEVEYIDIDGKVVRELWELLELLDNLGIT